MPLILVAGRCPVLVLAAVCEAVMRALLAVGGAAIFVAGIFLSWFWGCRRHIHSLLGRYLR